MGIRKLTDRRREYLRIKVSEKRQEIKRKAVEYLGGSCMMCGYNRCIASLDFHHRNPEEKDFRLSDGKPRKWDTVQKELDKCDLLCKNCHCEVHHEETMRIFLERKRAWYENS